MKISYSITALSLILSVCSSSLLMGKGVQADSDDGGLCFGKEELETKLDFFNSKVTTNTLEQVGGMIKYEDIGIVRDREVDLIVSVVEGTTYYSNRASVRNGLLGEFGQINIMNKKNNARQDGEGNFQFCFHDHETGDLTAVDSFHWSFYDIDERNEAENGIKEKIRFDTSQVTDFILYPNEQDSEVMLSCEDGTTPLPCEDGVRTVFHSSTKGTGGDNPKDPQNLTEQQKKRSVVFTFKDTSCFTVTMDHYCAVDNCSWYGGGNFMFSGNADEIIEKGECITSPPELTSSPTKNPTMEPTISPTKNPTMEPTMEPTSPPTKDPTMSPTAPLIEEAQDGGPTGCLGKQNVTTDLDFFNSEVTESSLSTGGVIRYENIGIVRDRDVDLVVSIVEGSTSPSKSDAPNGKDGLFGNIGLYTVKGDLKSGEGNFRFCFHDHESGDLTTVDSFRWSVYDIDSRNAADNGIKEKMIMDITQVEDFILYPNEDESEVKLSCEDKTPLPCNAGVRTVFHSSTNGTGPDNPSDPNNLTEQQKSRSVVFTFKDTSCWEFTYDHYCRIELEEGGKCRWYGGGNFLFSGDAKEIIEEGECVTPSPTVTPIRADTNGAGDDDDFFLPTTCPDDVKLIKQQGFTPFPEDAASAVRIVSQDTSTVTVKLEQAWMSSTVIDYIHYEYKESLFDLKCYEEVDVNLDTIYDTITIQCNVMSPKAFLQICVTDDISKEFLTLEDDGTVPQCCHSTTPVETPTVCYSLEINCETECAKTTARRNLRRGGSSS